MSARAGIHIHIHIPELGRDKKSINANCRATAGTVRVTIRLAWCSKGKMCSLSQVSPGLVKQLIRFELTDFAYSWFGYGLRRAGDACGAFCRKTSLPRGCRCYTQLPLQLPCSNCTCARSECHTWKGRGISRLG